MDKSFQDSIERAVEVALNEDVGDGDVTAALINVGQQASGQIICRENTVVCGIPWANEVFNQIDNSIMTNWKVKEGNYIEAGQTLCEISGSARNILTAERTALNFLQTLCATATITRTYAQLVEDTSCKILDTRKTIPGLRLAQKYAVTIGGGQNHRIGLYDGVLIKENHIRSAGSIRNAVSTATHRHGESIMIEVEVESITELEQALMAGTKRIMLDNFDIKSLKQAVEINKSQAKLEASGNITADNLREIALTGVDYISLGALTKNIQAIDLSLLFEFTD